MRNAQITDALLDARHDLLEVAAMLDKVGHEGMALNIRRYVGAFLSSDDIHLDYAFGFGMCRAERLVTYIQTLLNVLSADARL